MLQTSYSGFASGPYWGDSGTSWLILLFENSEPCVCVLHDLHRISQVKLKFN